MQIKNPLISKAIKKKVHNLKPVVIVGVNGLSDAVLNEIETALCVHELIKIKINSIDRNARNEIVSAICKKTNANLVQSIGNIIAIYREDLQINSN